MATRRRRKTAEREDRKGFVRRFNRFVEADHPRGSGGRFRVKDSGERKSSVRRALDSLDRPSRNPDLSKAQAATAKNVLKPVDRLTPAGQKNLDRSVEYAKSKGINIVGNASKDIESSKGDKAWGIAGMYHPGTKTIYLNERSPYWNDPKSIMGEASASGWLSTDRPSHVIVHEIAHAEHHAKVGDAEYNRIRSLGFSEQGKSIASRVSRYAASKPVELVAEMRTGFLSGKTYDPETTALYRKYGGPE